ncbi:hypothetical protein CU097_012616 [Rhizopus azygosporus]|uniref:Ras GEF n=1 Tax=Rhizopus azygosporus TaxID=86630 RepID=A0A367KF36_RHIAZ|nr:hypothetical protein CU097_012616 [Rhizopus azygosporus]
MNTKDIICQVRALYPYEPKDPSALSFKANAIIDVFAQLESGWWDGCCEGRRGWFPSNYVEILKQAPTGRRILTDQHIKEQLRLSLHASDMILNKSNAPASSSSSHSNNQSEWILQTTEDGSEQYYYNIRTHEMRHSIPPEGYVTTEEEDDLIPPARPVRAANRMEGSSQLLDDIYDKLPPGWMRKITPQGRYYYCNPETEETTWELENIDPDTGMLIPSQPNSPPSSPSEISFDLKDTPITWSTLSATIAHAIHNLKECIRAGKTTYIQQESAQVVQRIRLLLYVSNCLDKESSVHLKSNKQLRAVHRNLLASVAKLILSAKMTSSAWPSPETLGKLMSEAEEILMSVRHFMTWAQDMRIELKEKAGPTLAIDRPLWKNPIQVNSQHYHRAMLSGQPDAVTAIMVLADNVRGAISSFMESIRDAYSHIHNDQDIKSTLRKLKANAPLLVAQFRNLSNTTSQFMNTVEQVHEDDNLKSVAIMKAKHPIYAAMGSLFVVTQQITNSGMNIVEAEAAYERINEAVQAIENSIENAVDYSQMDEEEIAEEVKTEDEEVKEEEQQEQPKASSSSNPSPVKDVKIAKFFGEDPPPPPPRNPSPTTPSSPSAGAPATNTQGEVPWFLAADIDPNEIALNVEGQVKGGTLHGLVKRLTQHDQFDAKFNTTFLLTYRSFCSTEELFNELFQRYQLQPPEELTAEEREQWSERKLKLIRLRVFNVIKSWLETYYNEEEDRPILLELSQFTDHVISHSMKFGAEQLTRLIKKRMLAEESGQIRKMKLNVRQTEMPPSILPKNMKRIKLLELDPHELARQMTIMDFRLYNRIKPVECLDKNWGKPDTEEGTHIAANVKASIEHSNQVTAWVTDSILSKEEVKKRAAVLKHWIAVADRCRILNNFNTCMAILSAFDNGSIGRLKRTWELINGRSMQILQNIRRLMGANRNFSNYREIIHRVIPPCIPFLGIYLQDLTFIEDGNSNFLKKSNNFINFAKRMKTAEVIQDLQQYQSIHYMLNAVPDIQEFIKTHLQSSRDEEELYNLSLKLEPREQGEDTIARRLKESGL